MVDGFRQRAFRVGSVCCVALALLFTSPRVPGSSPAAQAPSTFASNIAALSEPGGYFDTDNLISNERSYLQVIPALRRAGVRGGAYLGVGPDQNFSYIAEVRPTVAYIVDVRRDNLLLHLLFKALFELSATRVEYLAHLFGRPAPPAINGWRGTPIDRLVGYLERTPPHEPVAAAAVTKRIDEAIKRTGVPLSADDFATIHRFHQRFVAEGVALRFTSLGRPPQYYYPTYGELLLETDTDDKQTNYLASEDAFQFLKSLQARDQVIPVVGDISGTTAVAAIGRAVAARGERLSAFYTSNVEFYLFGQGSYPRFIANLRQLPRAPHSVVIRSVFGRYTGLARPGDGSSSQLHPVGDLLSGYDGGRYKSYGQLVLR